MSYADILTTIMGVQNYIPQNNPDLAESSLFPEYDVPAEPVNRIQTKKELLGVFNPVMPEFNNRPLWSLLQQFLNPTINEMYTCMKPNQFGRIMPTLVARQIPFTTDAFDTSVRVGRSSTDVGPDDFGPSNDTGKKIAVTRFSNLPRWAMHPLMFNDVDIGRSDATRFNFIHVYGQDATQAPTTTISQQITNNPPIRDDLDIQRAGLRPYMTTVACANANTLGKAPTVWMRLIADRLIGSHLTLNGTISSIGIFAPIMEGDNVQYDENIYHIESVNHHCSIGMDGAKDFTTILTLSNGLRDTEKAGDAPIYPGVNPEDNTHFDPGVSVDDSFDRTPPSVDKGDLATADPAKTESQALSPFDLTTDTAVDRALPDPADSGHEDDPIRVAKKNKKKTRGSK
jgi:hypothetical protein